MGSDHVHAVLDAFDGLEPYIEGRAPCRDMMVDLVRRHITETGAELERLRAVAKAARGYVKAQTARRANRAVIDGERRVQQAYVDLRRVLADLPHVDSSPEDESGLDLP